MLEQIDLTKKLSKKEYKEKMEQLQPQLAQLQRTCKSMGIPVMIVFEGFGAAGKGPGSQRLFCLCHRVRDGRGADASIPVEILD